MSKLSPKQKKLIQKHLGQALERHLRQAPTIKTPKLHHKHIYQLTHQLFEENANVKVYLEILFEKIDASGLNSPKLKRLIANVENLPIANEFILWLLNEPLEKHCENDLEIVLPCTPAEFSTHVQRNISCFIQEELESPPIDERQQTQERTIRRMDSLARLFSLKPSLSVCTAVTFFSDRLLISANVSKQDNQIEIAEHLKQRIAILKEAINLAKNEGEAYLKNDTALANIYQQLMQHGGSALSREVMLQALGKFLHAICFDQTTLTEHERAIFQQPNIAYGIVLPTIMSSQRPGALYYNATTNEIEHLTTFDITISPHMLSVDVIHAEQLLAYYIFKRMTLTNEQNQANDTLPLRIGISKLCCQTCYEALQAYPVEVRGTHGLRYGKVFNLLGTTITQNPATPTRPRGITYACLSQPTTHLKPPAHRRPRADDASPSNTAYCSALRAIYFGEKGMFPCYLSARHQTYQFWDFLEATCTYVINQLAKLLGIYSYTVATQKEQRERYIHAELEPTFIAFTNETASRAVLQDVINKGLTLFSPRKEDHPNSLQFCLRHFEKALDATEDESLFRSTRRRLDFTEL